MIRTLLFIYKHKVEIESVLYILNVFTRLKNSDAYSLVCAISNKITQQRNKHDQINYQFKRLNDEFELVEI